MAPLSTRTGAESAAALRSLAQREKKWDPRKDLFLSLLEHDLHRFDVAADLLLDRGKGVL